MSDIDTPQIIETAVQSTAVIYITCPRSEIRAVMGPAHVELAAALAAQGVVPTGPWFTRHFKMTPDVFDFEIGFPVPAKVAVAGRVSASELPATTVARTIYHGPYEGLPGAWPKLEAWIASQGRKSAPSLWETYLVDPSKTPDPSAWRTELTRPLL